MLFLVTTKWIIPKNIEMCVRIGKLKNKKQCTTYDMQTVPNKMIVTKHFNLEKSKIHTL